jgi:hypothetical protein
MMINIITSIAMISWINRLLLFLMLDTKRDILKDFLFTLILAENTALHI